MYISFICWMLSELWYHKMTSCLITTQFFRKNYTVEQDCSQREGVSGVEPLSKFKNSNLILKELKSLRIF